jgi:hypothetical protein
MGLPWSMENILEWRSQYDRMKRWLAKLREFGRDQEDEERLDLYLAFFLNCYSLLDWFVKSGGIDASEIHNRIQASEAMRLCRDICNRSKHMQIGSPHKPSTEADFSLAREYTHRGSHLQNCSSALNCRL